MRLTRSEVTEFQIAGRVGSKLEFASDEEFTYSLVSDADANEVSANMADGIEIRVPAAIAEHWTSTEDVGIGGEMSVGNDRNLKVLVEKDFTCLVPRSGDEDVDTFPHPKAASASND